MRTQVNTLLIYLLLSFQGFSATYNVTRTDDPIPDNCTIVDCSLREAVIAANNNLGMDVINLGADSYVLTVFGDDEDSLKGDLDVKDDVRIQGVASNLTFLSNSTNLYRIFDIKFGVDFILQDIALTDTFTNIKGGAIKIDEASVVLNDVIIANNRGGLGGGVFAQFSEVEINDSLVLNNRSSLKGGGIYLFESIMEMNNSFVIGNDSELGGGISAEFLQSHPLETVITINDSLISNNKANTQGGGIYLVSESQNGVISRINNSYLWNNQSNKGAGIFQLNSIGLTITNTVFYLNRANINLEAANANGGGLFVAGDNTKTTIENSLLVAGSKHLHVSTALSQVLQATDFPFLSGRVSAIF